MEKLKLLSVFLMCLAIVSTAAARTAVINVDINGYNDDTPYEGGEGAYPGGDVWRVFYGWNPEQQAGTWARACGSENTDNLSNGEPNVASEYEAQVWIGDVGSEQGSRHYYKWGTALMDDGFIEDVNFPGDGVNGEPNIKIFGRGAYTGTFDIYVYGANDGNFTMSYDGCPTGSETKSVTGGYSGTFVEGQNYVVFEDVHIGLLFDPNRGGWYRPWADYAYEPNDVILTFTKTLNALQLVKHRDPNNRDAPDAIRVPAAGADANVFIPAHPWDKAGDYNNRATGAGGDAETELYGPTQSYFEDDVNYPQYAWCPEISTFDWWEYAEYDINVVDGGKYDLTLLLNTYVQDSDYIYLSLDGRHIGRSGYLIQGIVGEATPKITVNITEGLHSVGWRFGTLSRTGCSIMGMYIRPAGDADMNDCYAVVNSDFNYDADLNKDCVVDLGDVGIIADQWIICNEPNQANCP